MKSALGGLRVVVTAADASAHGRADHHLGVVLAAGPIPELRHLADDLVVRGIDEVRELDLRHGHEAVHRHADRGADDASLAERRVDHAVVAELLLKPLGHAEHAAELPDVFAEHHDPRVATHLQTERVVDRLHHVHARHVSAPSLAGPPAARPSALSGATVDPRTHRRTSTPKKAARSSPTL